MATGGVDAMTTKISEACEAGEKFMEVFYETMDKRRQVISGFYSDTSFVVWNGHPKTGSTEIASFYQSLPGSQHSVSAFDCQPVQDGQDGQGQSSVLVVCQGTVKFDGQKEEELFSQNFILSKQGEVWKVGSDCFRFLDQL